MPLLWSTWYECWSLPPASKAEDLELVKLDPDIKIINLAMVPANFSYTSWSLNGTGLGFNVSFDELKRAFAMVASKGQTIMFTVGGAGGNYNNTAPYANYQGVVQLANDLGAHGIDIDWYSYYKQQAWTWLYFSF